MTTLYGYSFNTESHTLSAAETQVNETEKQYTVEKGDEKIPFLYKSKLLKAEIGRINNNYSSLTVYLTERDGLKARQLILDYLKERLVGYEKKVSHYKACINSLTGGDADA